MENEILPSNHIPYNHFYGVWIRGTGWLKVDNRAVSFTEKAVAQDAARRVGGEVRFIDDSLKDLEQNILSLEAQKKRWQFWRK